MRRSCYRAFAAFRSGLAPVAPMPRFYVTLALHAPADAAPGFRLVFYTHTRGLHPGLRYATPTFVGVIIEPRLRRGEFYKTPPNGGVVSSIASNPLSVSETDGTTRSRKK